MSKPLDPERPGKFSYAPGAGLEHTAYGIADMADALDLGCSTTHRHATTLRRFGYLEKGPSRKYRISAHASDVGLAPLDSMALRRAAKESLKGSRAHTDRIP